MGSSLRWEPLSPFGAWVDVDLRDELGPAQADDLRQLFADHQVLVFSGQDLSEEHHVRVLSHLGPVPSDGVDLTSNDPAVGLQGDIRLAFHSDLAFAEEPDLGASLFALDLVDEASTTSFANGIRAYERLTPELRGRIQGLEAVAIWPFDQTRRNRATEIRPTDPRCAHPVVWTHPVSGRPILYLSHMQTDCIVGLSEADSEALLAELFAVLLDPAEVLVHRWHVGDLVVWDNLATQHSRDDISQVGRRTLRRVSIARRSFLEQFPQFATTQASGFVDERHTEAAHPPASPTSAASAAVT